VIPFSGKSLPNFSNFAMLYLLYFQTPSEKVKLTMTTARTLREKFSFTSSIAADIWSPKPNAKAYEWWYFDALSDDGRDAVVIIFLDNFIFSPRYNRRKEDVEKERRGKAGSEADISSKEANPKSRTPNPKSNVPAVAFTYYRDGKPVYRAINEFPGSEFSASEDAPECRIGENFFRFESAPYGSGYFISVKARLRKNCTLEAQFEWLAIEGDFLPDKLPGEGDAHVWNLVVSRADVSGRINVKNEKGKDLTAVHFRGTGYHDHNYDNRWLPETVQDWQWGRGHFTDASAVFYRYQECDASGGMTKLFTIRNGELREREADYDEQQFARDIFGIKYPQRLTFLTEDNMRLRVKQTKIIDSSFFYLRFLSEMTLTLRDGKPRKSTGITEYLNPKALKYRWLDWLVSMRIGRNGKGSFLP
jgi:carotenoid 1,2-hydratase